MTEFLPNPADLFARISEGFLSAINSGSAIDLAMKGVLAYLLAVWIAFVIWVVRDITNRSESLVVQTLSILLIVAFTPIFGLPLYLLVRPRSTLFERYYEEIGLAQAEEIGSGVCDRCGGAVGSDYRYCPHCRNELLVPCPFCDELIGKGWEHCAYCGKNVEESEKGRKKPEKTAPDRNGKKAAARSEKKPSPRKATEPGVVTESESPDEIAPPRTLPDSESVPEKKKSSVVRIEEIPEAGK